MSQRTSTASVDQLRGNAFAASDTAFEHVRQYHKASKAALDTAREQFEQALEQSAEKPGAYQKACQALARAHNEHQSATAALQTAIELRKLMNESVLRF